MPCQSMDCVRSCPYELVFGQLSPARTKYVLFIIMRAAFLATVARPNKIVVDYSSAGAMKLLLRLVVTSRCGLTVTNPGTANTRTNTCRARGGRPDQVPEACPPVDPRCTGRRAGALKVLGKCSTTTARERSRAFRTYRQGCSPNLADVRQIWSGNNKSGI